MTNIIIYGAVPDYLLIIKSNTKEIVKPLLKKKNGKKKS